MKSGTPLIGVTIPFSIGGLTAAIEDIAFWLVWHCLLTKFLVQLFIMLEFSLQLISFSYLDVNELFRTSHEIVDMLAMVLQLIRIELLGTQVQ